MEKINKYDLKPIKNIDNLNWEDYIFFETLNDAKNTPKEAIIQILNSRDTIKDKDEEISELNKLAYYDELTWLLNRHWYKKYIEKFKLKNIDIIFCDLDGLWKINNQHWFIMWDQAITIFSSIIKKYFRIDDERNIFDLLIRYGWDEFVIISTWIPEKKFTSIFKNIKKDIININKLNLWYEFSWTLSEKKWIKYKKIEKTINMLHDKVKSNKNK